ncbi:MAG: 3-oxoacyl-[acyl-carrier-protein] reductase [FCB group bacterium]|nr:3-oxoacyl-[acyl-carrier-protein] reductase [FCB group bacterium]
MFMEKTVVVTGAARGIGFAISKKLIDSGWIVAGCDILERDLQKAAEKLGDKFHPYILDVSNEEAVKETAEQIEKDMGVVNGLVNNAGITRDGLILRMTMNDWDAVMKVNLTGAFLMCRAFARKMLKQRQGSIVNISSVVALLGSAGQANYASTKAGLIGLTRSLSREFASRNIRVNAIAPGFIETGMTGELPEEMKKVYADKIPMKRMGVSEDVASAVEFLLGENSIYITGVVLPVDGGLTN